MSGLAWVPVSKRRIAALRAGAVVMLCLLIVRLVLVSVFPGGNYKSLAAQEGYAQVSIAPQRGTIYDDTGQVLAISEPRNTVVADPVLVQNPMKEAAILSRILGLGASQIRTSLLASGQFSFVDHQITAAQSAQISANAQELPGISLINEPLRVRPDQALAASVLGNVSVWGQGQGGIEQQMNSILAGKAGQELLFDAASGSQLPGGAKTLVAPQQGTNLTLTLDSAIQLRTEQALSDEMVATQARQGVAIVMNYKTGAILAMANLVAGAAPNSNKLSGAAPADQAQPHFTYTEQSPINMAVDNVYEPGSVAKIATFAAALKKGVITPSSEILVPDQILLDGFRFHDAETHAPEILSPKLILAQSSNVGTIMIGQHLTPTQIDASFRNFGWGVPSGLNLPGESPGFLDPPAHWSGTAPGSVPIGQDEAVTPLQVIDSFNAIANYGNMATPELVAKTGTHKTPIRTRRVISNSLASVMRGLLSGVTGWDGTAPAAAVNGFTISGKTGTASIPYGGGRSGYIPGQYMATFVGFTTDSTVPLSAVVVLTQPNQMYGGLTSAKVFSKVMSYSLYREGAVAEPTLAPSSTARTPVAVALPDLAPVSTGCRWAVHRFGASVLGANCEGRPALTVSSLAGIR